MYCSDGRDYDDCGGVVLGVTMVWDSGNAKGVVIMVKRKMMVMMMRRRRRMMAFLLRSDSMW